MLPGASSTLAFEIITDKNYTLNPKMKIKSKTLASCSGHTGIAGGQELDLKFENKNKRVNQIIDMERKKWENINFCLYSVGIIITKQKKKFFFKQSWRGNWFVVSIG